MHDSSDPPMNADERRWADDDSNAAQLADRNSHHDWHLP
jgi:hypothetical protein